MYVAVTDWKVTPQFQGVVKRSGHRLIVKDGVVYLMKKEILHKDIDSMLAYQVYEGLKEKCDAAEFIGAIVEFRMCISPGDKRDIEVRRVVRELAL